MRKWVSYSFILLASVILIAHSLVPHVHNKHSELSIQTSSQHQACQLGFLSKFFSLDLGGEEHLENYLSIKPFKVKL
ncbi:MAG: hypothetical protein AAGI07_14525, partial [Bacteroidota bacterium]